ncbi:hypothetical protein [Denitromonas halophila]|uniref:hypothetical protein n=1 Tax=Denitromonas halophila TaxID=1629404 RepID=UPI00164316F6|nr:hypothetical protein [Denitromonas halophila]
MNWGHAIVLAVALVAGADRIGAAIQNMNIKLNCNITVEEAADAAPTAPASDGKERI